MIAAKDQENAYWNKVGSQMEAEEAKKRRPGHMAEKDNDPEFDEYTKIVQLQDTRREKGQYAYQKQLESFAKDAAKGFKMREKAYRQDIAANRREFECSNDNVTAFTGQPFALKSGQWLADDDGVRKVIIDDYGQTIPTIACPHPIMPVEKIKDSETGEESVRLLYTWDCKHWDDIVISRFDIADQHAILKLAKTGISVTTVTARALIQYLQDVEALNHANIPKTYGINRLGWLEHYGFAPYARDLQFCGGADNKVVFNSVQAQGNYEDWKIKVDDWRRYSPPVNLAIAASFASVLLQIVDIMPFCVNLYGGSGLGKTVAQEIAASVWAKPKQYMTTLNSTTNAIGKRAGFLCNLPLIMDELQTVGKDGFDVYAFCEGQSRMRMTASLELRENYKWRNIAILSGEGELAKDTDAGGKLNRVLDIECRTKLVENGNKTVTFLAENYGYAGQAFIDYLMDSGVNIVKRAFKLYCDNWQTKYPSAPGKQTQQIAILQAANLTMNTVIFGSDLELSTELLEEIIHDETAEIEIGQRGYEALCGWVAQNQNHFINGRLMGQETAQVGEVYGQFCVNDIHYTGEVWIYKDVFLKAVESMKAVPSVKQLLHWLTDNGKIVTSRTLRGQYMSKRICGRSNYCLCLRLPDEEETQFVALADKECPFD